MKILKVLIVDDSRVMRSVVKRCLHEAGFTRHTYLEAGDVEEALRVISTQNPDFVLTDLYMPGLTGMELLEEMKRRGVRTRVGFITSETHPVLAETAINEGALFVLTKPPTAPALKKALAAVLG